MRRGGMRGGMQRRGGSSSMMSMDPYSQLYQMMQAKMLADAIRGQEEEVVYIDEMGNPVDQYGNPISGASYPQYAQQGYGY